MLAKKAFVKRFASVRFDGVLDVSQRADATRALRSAGATVTSWNGCGDRTYATLTLAGDEPGTALPLLPRAEIVTPPLLVVRIVPEAPRTLGALERALGGAGRPAGIRDVRLVDGAVVVECDAALTTLATLVALVDVELATAPGRTIEPLVGLDDDALVAFAGAMLAEPGLDASRLIEPHRDRALAASAR
ncbi:MAG: hypothetical protein NVSMB19_15280 [Vulcanimicrobiaceae bacterium]